MTNCVGAKLGRIQLTITQIIFKDTNQKITYLYAATGQKMQKQVTQNSHTATTQYMGGYQYSNTRLQFFPTAEGYVKNTIIQGQNSYDYVYNLTDHLGNIRMSFGLDPKTQQLVKFEENNYYPFGLKHSRYNDQLREITEKQSYSIQLEDFITEKRSAQKTLAIPSNPDAEDIVLENSGYQYRFQSQEFQDELGMNVYFFKWRTYDPALGRFLQIDPVAESYVHNGVYNFAENRVVESIDLEGKESWYTQDGSLATKAGPYTSQARKQLNLYSPSEVQQMKAKQSNNKGPMLSQDRMSPSDRKKHDLAIRTQMAEKETIKKTLDNHENLGSPYTAKTVMEGAAYGAVDMATGAAMSKLFQGAKLLFTATKAEETIVVIGEGMGRVQGAKGALLENGAKNVEVFQPKPEAMAEWNALTAGGQHLSDDVVKGTMLYKENAAWIQQATQSGKTILDIGNDGRAIESAFYQMEKQAVYGH